MESRVMVNNRSASLPKLSLSSWAALTGYRLVMLFAAMAVLPLSPLLRRFSRRVAQGSDDFLGLVAKPAPGPVLWVHGVSMGESMVAAGFALELQRRFPQYQLVFSTTHPDVLASVKKRGFAGAVCYFPLDNYLAMRNIFERWRPTAVFVAETDFWPEFSYQCRQRQIPLILLNGRISAGLSRFYQTFSGLAQIIFRSYSLLAVQSQIDADRLIAVGADPAVIRVLGNMKADLTADPGAVDLQPVRQWLRARPCVIFGSIHPDEFALLKPQFARLIGAGIAIIVAPRHPGNAEKWRPELQAAGLTAMCRSKICSDQFSDILLLDTMGELAALYALGNVALVGGSLNPTVGGHNPLEVIQQQIPLLMGPNCRNFADLVGQLQTQGAMITCNDGEAVTAAIMRLLQDPSAVALQVEKANAVLAANRGVVQKTMDAVAELLPLVSD